MLIVLMLAAVLSVSAQQASADQQFEGQVVCCLDCWGEKDRLKVEFGTAEDLLKAKGCVEGGDPTLLAVRVGDKFSFYQLEEGKFKLEGENWLAFVGKRVLITGSVKQKKKAQILTVNELKVTAETIAAREAQEVLGKVVELKLKGLYGAEQYLSQFKGRIVILNFWATYCLPCLEEMPDLAEIQNEFAAFGVQVIGASADEAEDRPKVLEFIKETKVNFPIWLGAGTDDMVRFGLGGALPGTVIIDRNGKIVRVISGVINKDDVKKLIESMLATAESSVPKAEPEKVAKVAKPRKVSSVPS